MNVMEMIALLESWEFGLNNMIGSTPTGTARNTLTEINILRMKAINELLDAEVKKVEREGLKTN